jgi:hypothetical protein
MITEIANRGPISIRARENARIFQWGNRVSVWGTGEVTLYQAKEPVLGLASASGRMVRLPEMSAFENLPTYLSALSAGREDRVTIFAVEHNALPSGGEISAVNFGALADCPRAVLNDWGWQIQFFPGSVIEGRISPPPSVSSVLLRSPGGEPGAFGVNLKGRTGGRHLEMGLLFKSIPSQA